MDGSRTGFAEFLTPSAVPKYSSSGGINENELNQDQLVSKDSKGFKKSPSPKKHFMSPTISAASKAFVPRKKVLAERNQAPDGEPTHFAKPFNLSPKISASFSTISRKDAQSCSSTKCSTICPTGVQSCSFEIDHSGDQNDPSLKPYDPVTNYLSPRPTFLRYNLNRRYQLLLHLENEAGPRKCECDVQEGLSFDAKKPTHEEAVGEDNYGYSVSCSKDSQGFSVSCSDEGSVEEDEMIDDYENAGEKNNGVDVPKDLSFETEKPGFEEVLRADTQGSSVSCIDEVSVNDDNVQEGLSFDAKKPTHEEAVGEDIYGYSVSCSEDSQGSSVSCSDEGSVEEDEMIDDYENAGEENTGVDVPKDLSFETEKPGFEEVSRADTQGSSVSCIEEVSLNDDDEKIGKEDAEDYDINEVVDEEEQEEIEVFEEERGWSLKGVLKFSFVIVSLILSTLYISSMNSPLLLNNLEARWGWKDQHHRFQYVVGLNSSESASESSIDYWGKTEIGLLKFKLGEVSYGFEGENAIGDGKKGLVEIIAELGEVEAEVQDVQIECARGIESGSGEEWPVQLQVPVTAKSKDQVLDSIAVGSDQLRSRDFTQSECKKALVEIIDELGEVEAEVQDVQIEGACGNESGSGEEGPDQLQVPVTAKPKDEVLDSSVVGSDQLRLTDFTQSEGFEYYKMEKAEDDSDKLPVSEAGETNSGSASEVEKMATEDTIEPVEKVSNQMLKDEVERAEDIDNNEVDDLNAGNVESDPQNPESDSFEFPLGKAKFDSIPAVAIGVPILFTILASLGVVYYLRRKKVSVEESLSMDEPLVEPVLAEKITTPLPSSVKEEEGSDGGETFASTSSLFRPVPEGVAKEISHSQSHAPSVELLGELVIGEVSSSLKSRGAKSGYLEKEESHNSVSQTAVSSQANATSYLELSTADLDGSSTREKKIVEKKLKLNGTLLKRGNKEAESTPVRRASRILPSPVRRSSRLRERSALSP